MGHSERGIKQNDQRKGGAAGFHCVPLTYIPLAWWRHGFGWLVLARRLCVPSVGNGNDCDDPFPSASGG